MDDDSNVPRRLRRFIRKGEPIPENLLPKEQSQNEPWNQPAVTVRAKSTISISSRQASEEAIAPRHRGKRFQEVQENASQTIKPMDQALGLEKKVQLEARTPQSGTNVVKMKKDEIQQALDEIKKFHASTSQSENASSHVEQMIDHITEQAQSKPKQEEKNASFHFTPIASAPNAAEPEKLSESSSPASQSNASSAVPDKNKLTPRERMELRRQQHGQTIPSAATSTPESSGQKKSPTPTLQESRSHIRRRAGQVSESQGGEENISNADAAPATPDEFKDLFGDTNSPSKKKLKKPVNEEEELDSEEDMELFEDEGK